jgi:hypothetical protein
MQLFRRYTYITKKKFKQEQLDKLVKDKDWTNRAIAAQYGTDSHRDQLVSDPHEIVREMVAMYGNFNHKKSSVE